MPLELKKRFSKTIRTPESRTRARSNGISEKEREREIEKESNLHT